MYFCRRFDVALAVGTISLFSYFPFLFNGMTVIKLPYLALWLALVLIIVLVDLCKDLYPTVQLHPNEAPGRILAGATASVEALAAASASTLFATAALWE